MEMRGCLVFSIGLSSVSARYRNINDNPISKYWFLQDCALDTSLLHCSFLHINLPHYLWGIYEEGSVGASGANRLNAVVMLIQWHKDKRRCQGWGLSADSWYSVSTTSIHSFSSFWKETYFIWSGLDPEWPVSTFFPGLLFPIYFTSWCKERGIESQRSVHTTGVHQSPVWDMYLSFLPSGNQGTADLCGCCVWKKKGGWSIHSYLGLGCSPGHGD